MIEVFFPARWMQLGSSLRWEIYPQQKTFSKQASSRTNTSGALLTACLGLNNETKSFHLPLSKPHQWLPIFNYLQAPTRSNSEKKISSGNNETLNINKKIFSTKWRERFIEKNRQRKTVEILSNLKKPQCFIISWKYKLWGTFGIQ